MTPDKLAFMSFEPNEGHFEAFISVDGLLSHGREGDPEPLLKEAAHLYETYTGKMRQVMAEIRAHRAARKLVPARKIWQLGNIIFELTGDLASLSFQVNDLYVHLARDLGAKRKWLEKVIIFRRYLPDEEAIPPSLNWGRCEKGTRRIAERLLRGLPVG